MDKWEEMMKKFMAMPETECMKQMEQSKTMCVCTNCPSYRGTRGNRAALLWNRKKFNNKGRERLLLRSMSCSSSHEAHSSLLLHQRK